MIEIGIAMAAMSVVRMLARKKKMTIAARRLPSDQVLLERADGRLDEDRLIVEHARP